MLRNSIVNKAVSSLTETERELYILLTSPDASKKAVIDFLHRYDIDNQNASTSYLINHLLDCFNLDKDDCANIPRIRGLKEYFHFYNAKAIMLWDIDNIVFDVNLGLKIRYPDETRPFTLIDSFFSRRVLSKNFGELFVRKIEKDVTNICLQGVAYHIPNDSSLSDLIYLGLYCSCYLNIHKECTICYLYDIYRYASSNGPSIWLQLAIIYNRTRNMIKRVVKWLLK